ncbi:MAG: hypothetical protein QNL83_01165, partial [OM182 bacterium]
MAGAFRVKISPHECTHAYHPDTETSIGSASKIEKTTMDLIAIAVPFFLALILAEFIYGIARGRNT